MFGVRIPSQDKHSGVNIEWVDMLPAHYGSAVVVPKEIVNLSGHDFDIDKLYIHQNHAIETEEGLQVAFEEAVDDYINLIIEL